MKRLFLVLSFASIFFLVGAKPDSVKSGKGINFSASGLAQAMHLAKEQKKLIFIDIGASWCVPCNMLKLKTFPNQKAGEFFNANFISLSLDGEKGEGLKLFKAYQLTSYPTLIILDSNGKPIIATMGYIDAKGLIQFGKAGIEKSSQ